MNKKFLSAILFGALMVTSTGTFVSCKDYDDDIENLQGQISANASAIAELKALIGDGNYVTSVTLNGNNLVVATKNGSTTLALPECEDEVGSFCEVVDGVLYIDGKATDIKACEGTTEEGEFLPAVAIVDGEWAVLQEDGTYKSTGVEVSSVAVSGNKTAGYVLTVKDAEGNETVIELPTAASKITNLSLGNEPQDGWVVSLSDYKTWTTSGVIDDASKWKGPKTLPANGSKVYVNTADPLEMRIDPVGIDATELEYTLVSARNQINPSFKMVASEEILYRDWTDADVNGRAAYGNGLYTLDVKKFVVSGGQFAVEDFQTEYKNNMREAYAVTANGSYRSEYTVDVVALAGAPALEYLWVYNAIEGPRAGYSDLSSTGDEWTVKVGTTNQINFNSNKAMYDMYMTVEDKYIEPFGITWNDAARTFKVSKNPDSSSLKAGFPMTIYAVDNEGLVTKTTIQIKLSTIISPNYVYDAQSHDVSSDYNYFVIDLDEMKESISSDFAAWKLNVDLSKTEITMYYGMNSNGVHTKVYPGTDPCMNEYSKDYSDLFEYAITSAVKNDFSSITGNADNANFIQIAINNEKASFYKLEDGSPAFVLDHTYYAKVVFNSAEGQLNTIIVPIKFTAPALSDLFTVRKGYTDAEGVINAFFYNIEDADKAVELTTYFSKYVKDAEVALDGATTIYDNKKSSQLAESVDAETEFAEVAMQLTGDKVKKDKYGVKQLEAGYGEALICNVSKDNYETWKYPVNRDGSCPNGSYTFKMRMMSPILEGEVKPVSSITISGNDLVNGAKITSEMIMGYDYNDNKYNVVPDKYATENDKEVAAWANPEIVNVELAQDEDKYINENIETVAATQDEKGNTVNGYFVVKGKSISQTVDVKIPVYVEDVWGYILTNEIPVTIKKN